ncbi:Alcohol dehydrogenase zinc-binding domain protein [Thermobaculum terrenum ATCC BAA-798]|uniref:Alcohol dehydrogenase zinc-binding domain protein n=1 Tax=Thermobaculum terrenum (strain ATCC BAA-798 / CCMEE 7001 / YNP1) TaxID=525904 RepID=D1CGT8_THET1|nr:erythritol/L-threitol dehydrogenase [Thermobaculum terrenum]ACZ42959.1 Alcohol dehydrogenase zinc-binding domain protein [Thermobaculum terrenum ATCC BAA-798]
MSDDLPTSMRAVVCHGPEDYRLEELPVPRPGPGEVLVRVPAVGICASDLKCYTGAPMFWGDEHRVGYCQPPVVPGHEFVGYVVALGEGAGEKYGLQVGGLAVSEQIVPCWRCRFCRRGQYWMCQQHDVYGFRQRTFGAMAEYMLWPADAINHKVPPDVPPHHAAFIEPLACAIHAVDRGEIKFEDVVVIAGAGPLGLGMVAAARMRNPRLLVVVDLEDRRLEVARRCGADLTLNPSKVDVVEEVLGLTEGYGCDVYIEATGHPAAVEQGLRMIRKLGTFVEFSVMREPVTVDWTIIGDTKELNIHGAHLGPYCYPIAIDMIRKGRLPLDEIVTHRLPLEDFHRGIEIMMSREHSIKVVLEPNA